MRVLHVCVCVCVWCVCMYELMYVCVRACSACNVVFLGRGAQGKEAHVPSHQTASELRAEEGRVSAACTPPAQGGVDHLRALQRHAARALPLPAPAPHEYLRGSSRGGRRELQVQASSRLSCLEPKGARCRRVCARCTYTSNARALSSPAATINLSPLLLV